MSGKYFVEISHSLNINISIKNKNRLMGRLYRLTLDQFSVEKENIIRNDREKIIIIFVEVYHC